MVTIDGATFNISTHCEDYEPEQLGDGAWTFQYREVMRVCKKLPRFLDSGVTGDLDTLLENCRDEHDPEELGDATLSVWEADTAIAVVCAMIHLGGTWDLHYDGHGSEYWFWHDMCHARYDFGICSSGMCSADVDASAEMRAMIEGAKLARDNGVGMGDIVRQLVQAEQAWSERFGHDEFLIERFLD